VIFRDAVDRLERAFRHELPGPNAQARMAPVPRRPWPSHLNPARIRNAAGLLLVFPGSPRNLENAPRDHTGAEDAEHAGKDQLDSLHFLRAQRSRHSRSGDNSDTIADAAHIVLTVRAHTLERHGGQVSLPGGVVDPGETFERAALREAHEEVALTVDEIKVLGALTPLDIPVSGFRLHPIVAAAPVHPAMSPSDGEVARILEIDIDDLLTPSCVVRTTRERDGRTVMAPAFRAGGVEIWGATAMVLAEFLTLLGWRAPEAD
jgi:8-oxo-dGTP pyrophosphatase MutT (NUDIX family)